MSLITCCPACQTMFKVSGEDLRVSDGWVRCGNCDGVFDASAHLVMPPVQEESVAPAEPDAAAQVLVTPQPQANASSADRPSLFRAAASDESQKLEPEFVDEAELVAESESVAEMPAMGRVEPGPVALRREDRSARPSFADEPVSFSTHSGTRRSPWRVVFGLLALTLLLGALVAGARHERQTLVQHVPALLPVFDGLCALSACEVQAPSLPAAIVIEGATIEEVASPEFKVQLLLKNAGSVAVSLPSLNVTLTGLQGEVLANHVATPAQFAPGAARLNPGAPMSLAFTFQAKLPPAPPAASAPSVEALSAAPPDVPAAATAATAPAVSGYRVTAFYP